MTPHAGCSMSFNICVNACSQGVVLTHSLSRELLVALRLSKMAGQSLL